MPFTFCFARAVNTYLRCLRDKTDAGCVTADTVPVLAQAAEVTIKAISSACGELYLYIIDNTYSVEHPK